MNNMKKVVLKLLDRGAKFVENSSFDFICGFFFFKFLVSSYYSMNQSGIYTLYK